MMERNSPSKKQKTEAAAAAAIEALAAADDQTQILLERLMDTIPTEIQLKIYDSLLKVHQVPRQRQIDELLLMIQHVEDDVNGDYILKSYGGYSLLDSFSREVPVSWNTDIPHHMRCAIELYNTLFRKVNKGSVTIRKRLFALDGYDDFEAITVSIWNTHGWFDGLYDATTFQMILSYGENCCYGNNNPTIDQVIDEYCKAISDGNSLNDILDQVEEEQEEDDYENDIIDVKRFRGLTHLSSKFGHAHELKKNSDEFTVIRSRLLLELA